MNKELLEALDILEKEKEISKETLFEAIENSLLTACKNHFGKSDNVHVEIDRNTGDFLVYAEKEVVETADDVEDSCLQISLDHSCICRKKVIHPLRVQTACDAFLFRKSILLIRNTGSMKHCTQLLFQKCIVVYHSFLFLLHRNPAGLIQITRQ